MIFPAGDEVIVHPVSGAYADHVVAKASSCVPKPAGMSWEESAGLMLTGTAAAHLVSAAGVSEGETVLLNGAAGGVGLYAAQLARHRGARVLGTALPSDHEVLREMGVEPFDFREDVEAWVREHAPAGVDAVLDAVGVPPVLDLSLAVAKDRDRVATLIPSPAAAERGITQLGFGEGADPGTELRAAARLDLVRGVEEGWLRVVVAETHPLERAAVRTAPWSPRTTAPGRSCWCRDGQRPRRSRTCSTPTPTASTAVTSTGWPTCSSTAASTAGRAAVRRRSSRVASGCAASTA